MFATLNQFLGRERGPYSREISSSGHLCKEENCIDPENFYFQ